MCSSRPLSAAVPRRSAGANSGGATLEAISRLEALWRTWEALRTDPLLGMGTWYRDHLDHLDHQLPILTVAVGPFADCDPTRHFPARDRPARPHPGARRLVAARPRLTPPPAGPRTSPLPATPPA